MDISVGTQGLIVEVAHHIRPWRVEDLRPITVPHDLKIATVNQQRHFKLENPLLEAVALHLFEIKIRPATRDKMPGRASTPVSR